jgi:flagellar motor component MotA
MNTEDFLREYNSIVERALLLSETARREGLLAIEEKREDQKYYQRDIMEYGITFVVDGCDSGLINKILSNIINLEKDEDKKKLKIIQKEAVMAIQEGLNPRDLLLLLNSYVDVDLKETMERYGDNSTEDLLEVNNG